MMLQLKGVSKYYALNESHVTGLKDINQTISSGEFVALLGPSGSGKSTLLNLIGCLDTAFEGEYSIEGKNIRQMDDETVSNIRNQYIGFVFQSFHLLPRLTALENVLLPARYSHTDPEQARQRALMLLENVGLQGRETHKPQQLSGGQRQRVAIARALINQPKVLLADEPTGNLDSQASHEIMKLVSTLNAQGQTVVLVTHEQDIAAYAHKHVFLKDGEIQRVA